MSRDFSWWALRKLAIEEWLIKIVQSMNRNDLSSVKAIGTFSDNLLVLLGLHQGSVLSLLLFIIELEALSRYIRSGCPHKMLYADDLELISETLKGLEGRRKA